MNVIFVIVGYSLIRNYWNLNSKLFIMDNTVYLVALIYAINTVWISYFKKAELLKIFCTLMKDRENETFARLSDDILNFYGIKIGVGYVTLLTSVSLLPIFVAVFQLNQLGSTATLLFPCWYPWKIDSIQKYICTIILQLTSGGVLYLICISSPVSLVCCLISVQAHYQYFIKLTENLKTRGKYTDLEELEFNDKTKRKGKIKKYAIERYRTVIAYYTHLNRYVLHIR